LFLIASNGLPALKELDRWSEPFKDFLAQCTIEDPSKRPDAETLLKVRRRKKIPKESI
jgi:hypothetical protein